MVMIRDGNFLSRPTGFHQAHIELIENLHILELPVDNISITMKIDMPAWDWEFLYRCTWTYVFCPTK